MNRKTQFYFILIVILSVYSALNLHGSLELTNQSSRSHSAAICAIQKGALRYVDEWVDYNIAIGFEKIYIYDNSDEFELQEWYSNLKNEEKDHVEITHFPGPKRQLKATTHCTKQIQRKRAHSWIAYFDLDEFIVIRDTQKYPRIMDLLDDLPYDIGALTVNWVIFRMNNQLKYEAKPVTSRFQNRTENATNRHVKTIARAELVRYVVNPHFVKFKFWSKKSAEDTSGNKIEGPFNENLTDDVVVLHHYHTKSLEEYKERCKRGRADIPMSDWSEELPCQSDSDILNRFASDESVPDTAAWTLLKERVPKYDHFS
jgi:hypothetical protein